MKFLHNRIRLENTKAPALGVMPGVGIRGCGMGQAGTPNEWMSVTVLACAVAVLPFDDFRADAFQRLHTVPEFPMTVSRLFAFFGDPLFVCMHCMASM